MHPEQLDTVLHVGCCTFQDSKSGFAVKAVFAQVRYLCNAGGSAFVTMTLGMPLEVVMRRMQVCVK